MTAAALWSHVKNGVNARLKAAAARHKSLVLRESLSLGERRYIAIVECDGRRYLVGGGRDTVQLIADVASEAVEDRQ
jgi:flagellar biogenesis protein FliO